MVLMSFCWQLIKEMRRQSNFVDDTFCSRVGSDGVEMLGSRIKQRAWPKETTYCWISECQLALKIQ